MNNFWPPQDQTFWYLKRKAVKPCRKNIETEIAVVGGGIAGLSAAQAFHEQGKKVVLLEQYYCGAGASGKSSGFVTPNAELSLTDFSKRYSLEGAHKIWDFITSGVELIRSNCTKFNLDCGYAPQNTLIAATSKRGLRDLKIEHENLEKIGYSSEFYSEKTIQEILGSKKYYGGTAYQNTFGIDSYLYCQEIKSVLEKNGITIYEETPVTSIVGNTLKTAHATITADYIIFCTDRFMPSLGLLKQEVYHAQTFIMLSQVLTDEEIKLIFPGEKLLVWDTDFIYNYYRVTDQNRLILGGGNAWTTYSQEKHNYKSIQHKLHNYFKKKFPMSTIQFEQFWPGLIGISKDIGPIAGRDKDNQNHYYITAATGLPIAAALGRYSAEHILQGRNDLDSYFSPYRSFPIGGLAQKILGNKISFGLSNLLKLNMP